ncbi:hypothetical protein DAA48_21815 [Aeromonas veronii]|uniref:Uncharacterized protein n=1 Tax=Aeromonas veronii TaxID=654 RepID=A0A2T4MWX1_AERVE|nr:hypothetical protein DAA48_21815 [Aeromonas veronii]
MMAINPVPFIYPVFIIIISALKSSPPFLAIYFILLISSFFIIYLYWAAITSFCSFITVSFFVVWAALHFMTARKPIIIM